MRRELARLLRDARARGWAVMPTRAGHWRLLHPAGAIVHTGSTPPCPRALANLRADLRRVERQELRP